MRLLHVDAHAFGPLAGQRLALAPGLTVVWGPNEAGKSSWHAAAFAAVCGRRRGRGAPRRREQRFVEAHHPWDGASWRVGALAELADGRTIAFDQDLAGQVACEIRDAVLGTDLSGALLHDGSPDGARLLGLTREAFVATAWMRQADLLGVLDDPALVQEHLQRAAASGGADATATAALEAVAAFRRERVGADRRGSGRPLRRAREAQERAEVALAEARQAHEARLELLEERAAAERAVSDAEAAVGAEEAGGAEPADRSAATPPEEDALEQTVADALATWRARPPEPAPLEGPSAGALDDELARLDARDGPADPGASAASRTTVLLTAAVVGGLAATGLLVAGETLAGLAVLALSAAAAVDGQRRRRRQREAAETRARAQALRARRDARAALEAQAAAQRRQRAEAEEAVRDAAGAVGVGVGRAPAAQAEALVGWRRERAARRAGEQAARTARERQRRTADRDLAEARARLARVEGALAAGGDPDVAGAEEALAAARGERARVEGLAATLDRTAAFLETAREEVHRDIAPRLSASVAPRLAAVTGGRYDEVAVDPSSLAVRVRGPGGRWREAAALSHGTAEQVHLLLRVAIAEHLSTTGEPIPLLLDEPTAHADAARTVELLALLHGLAEERQVVVFTQEEDVRDWARRHMTTPRDALVELGAATPTQPRSTPPPADAHAEPGGNARPQ